jgi:hypothetical protein
VETASIAYHQSELQVCEQDGVWTVRLANLEARARYLDLALARLLGEAPEAHRIAARLLTEMAGVEAQQEGGYSHSAVRPRARHDAPRYSARSKPILLVLRMFAFAVVASTAFMLTTWLSALK